LTIIVAVDSSPTEQRNIPLGNRQLLEMTFKTEGFSVTDLIQLCDEVPFLLPEPSLCSVDLTTRSLRTQALRLSLQSVLHSVRAENTTEKVAAIKRFDPCWVHDPHHSRHIAARC
jgi:hypothetical protein